MASGTTGWQEGFRKKFDNISYYKPPKIKESNLKVNGKLVPVEEKPAVKRNKPKVDKEAASNQEIVSPKQNSTESDNLKSPNSEKDKRKKRKQKQKNRSKSSSKDQSTTAENGSKVTSPKKKASKSDSRTHSKNDKLGKSRARKKSKSKVELGDLVEIERDVSKDAMQGPTLSFIERELDEKDTKGQINKYGTDAAVLFKDSPSKRKLNGTVFDVANLSELTTSQRAVLSLAENDAKQAKKLAGASASSFQEQVVDKDLAEGSGKLKKGKKGKSKRNLRENVSSEVISTPEPKEDELSESESTVDLNPPPPKSGMDDVDADVSPEDSDPADLLKDGDSVESSEEEAKELEPSSSKRKFNPVPKMGNLTFSPMAAFTKTEVEQSVRTVISKVSIGQANDSRVFSPKPAGKPTEPGSPMSSQSQLLALRAIQSVRRVGGALISRKEVLPTRTPPTAELPPKGAKSSGFEPGKESRFRRYDNCIKLTMLLVIIALVVIILTSE